MIKWHLKRNVVFIALESIEKTFADKQYFDKVLTPEITKLERQNKSFENYQSMSGLSHTIAAITGFTTGLPLFFTSYHNFDKMVESVNTFREYLDGNKNNLSEDDLLDSLNKFISAYQPIQRVFQAMANIKF